MNKTVVTKIIFWIGFISFLTTSVPHVAWLYHVYEPDNSLVWWILAYAIAVSIDVLIAWLSFVQSSSDRVSVVITWCFIACLCMLSWYANYLYSLAHNPIPVRNLWSVDILLGFSTGEITPIIVSALPVFVIAYTFMLNIVNNTDSESLEDKATRLENEREVRDRIRVATTGNVVNGIRNIITQTKEITSYARQPQNGTQTLLEGPMIKEDTQIAPLLSQASIDSSQTQNIPIVTWSQDSRVESVQFPGKEPVIISDDKEIEKDVEVHTDRLVSVTSGSNGHSETNQFIPLQKYVPKSKRG